MRALLSALLLTSIGCTTLAQPAVPDPPLFTLDENTWVLFYDLPSRRFRTIRDAFVRREFEAAAGDLRTSSRFVEAEAARTDDALAPPLAEVIERLGLLADTIDSSDVTTGDLDAVFARTHWLLSQHYLKLAEAARNDRRHRPTGHYLWATAHHMERTVLWSDARLTPKLVRDVERLRTMADELRTSASPERVYRDRPIVSARNTLAELGAYLDRRVWVGPVEPL
ncbi:MAG: hypothetical protein R3288_07290 [Woeseiaceae bacterium]|nr:hypothetical protein [Woeseiaceae bacterium]